MGVALTVMTIQTTMILTTVKINLEIRKKFSNLLRQCHQKRPRMLFQLYKTMLWVLMTKYILTRTNNQLTRPMKVKTEFNAIKNNPMKPCFFWKKTSSNHLMLRMKRVQEIRAAIKFSSLQAPVRLYRVMRNFLCLKTMKMKWMLKIKSLVIVSPKKFVILSSSKMSSNLSSQRSIRYSRTHIRMQSRMLSKLLTVRFLSPIGSNRLDRIKVATLATLWIAIAISMKMDSAHKMRQATLTVSSMMSRVLEVVLQG